MSLEKVTGLNLPWHKFKLFDWRSKTKWLLQRAGLRGNRRVHKSRGVGGHIDDMDATMQLADLTRKFRSAQPRYHHIRQKNVDLSGVSPPLSSEEKDRVSPVKSYH